MGGGSVDYRGVKGRRAWIPVAALLAAVYLATAAPDVTFWDAGEFIAAAHALGIPHPPGTPLFVLLLHTWGLAWHDTMYAFGTNVFSALCTVVAGCLSATLIARWMRDDTDHAFGYVAGIAAAVCAGTMSTAWSNATETEVYAASLALAIMILFAADRAGRSGDSRWLTLVAYGFGLAVPLHISALVVAPAAIVLATSRATDATIDLPAAAGLLASAVVAMAIGTLSPMFILAGALAIAIAVAASFRARRSPTTTAKEVGALVGVAIIGATPLLFMLVRARFDPAINQGNPASVHAFLDVIARRQYDLAPLWPRRAPLWIQLGNWFEYADWQSALSLGPTVIPTLQRTAVSIAFAALALIGGVAHRKVDRRSWRALVLLFAAGSLGVTLYLNLRASPSFGWGVLPPDVQREARERDYFFVLGFWSVGLWAGIGAVTLARRWRLPRAVGLVAASLTIALNWNAVRRGAEPDASLPRVVARNLLSVVPANSVLFVGGDNDSYPPWYEQEVHGLRRDVTLVTLPLLNAPWYAEELRRRNPTLRSAAMANDPARLFADAARANGRPVAAALTLGEAERARLGGCWTLVGFALVDTPASPECQPGLSDVADRVQVDTIRTIRWMKLSEIQSVHRTVRASLDPVAEYFARLLNCPAKMLDSSRKNGRGVSLDSTCNP